MAAPVPRLSAALPILFSCLFLFGAVYEGSQAVSVPQWASFRGDSANSAVSLQPLLPDKATFRVNSAPTYSYLESMLIAPLAGQPLLLFMEDTVLRALDYYDPTGPPLWTLPLWSYLETAACADPVVAANGTLYILATCDARVFIISLVERRHQAIFPISGRPTTELAVFDNYLVVSVNIGVMLFALPEVEYVGACELEVRSDVPGFSDEWGYFLGNGVLTYVNRTQLQHAPQNVPKNCSDYGGSVKVEGLKLQPAVVYMGRHKDIPQGAVVFYTTNATIMAFHPSTGLHALFQSAAEVKSAVTVVDRVKYGKATEDTVVIVPTNGFVTTVDVYYSNGTRIASLQLPRSSGGPTDQLVLTDGNIIAFTGMGYPSKFGVYSLDKGDFLIILPPNLFYAAFTIVPGPNNSVVWLSETRIVQVETADVPAVPSAQPLPRVSPPPISGSPSGSSSAAWGRFGIIVGIVAFVALAIGAVVYARNRRRLSRSEALLAAARREEGEPTGSGVEP